LEEIDKKLFNDPNVIIDGGGYIFSLVVRHKVVGVCALFCEGDEVCNWQKIKEIND